MAANKFATTLHRNTNKMTLILVYAVLEWTLIVLLLLNSLFSYVILKFADYFGLKRPCLWCSRLEHVFEPRESNVSHRDLVCEAHATEISKLGYCLSHRKLADSRDMCEDCSSSLSSSSSSPETDDWSKKFAFFPWMKQIGMIKDCCESDMIVEEEEEENSKCSCCGVSLSNKRFYPPCIWIKPSSWGVLDYAQKKGLIEYEAGLDGDDDDHTVGADHSDHSRSDFVAHHREEEQGIEENMGILIVSDDQLETKGVEDKKERKIVEKEQVVEEEKIEEDNFGVFVDNDQACEQSREEEKIEEENFGVSMDNEKAYEKSKEEENSTGEITSEIPVQHLDFYIGQEYCTLIPVELIEPTKTEDQSRSKYKVEGEGSCRNQDVILDFDMDVKTQVELVTETWHSSGEILELVSSSTRADVTKLEAVDSKESSESKSSFVFHVEEGELESREFQPASVSQGTQTVSDDEDGNDDDDKAMECLERDLDVQQGSDDDQNMAGDEIDGEISIGTEIPDHEPIDEMENEESQTFYRCVQDGPSTSSINLHIDDNHVLDFERVEEDLVEFKPLSVQTSQREMENHLAFGLELNDIEEEKIPDTPNSIDSLHLLHKKLLLLERRESGTEDSLDGSVMSDIEGTEGIPAVEKLRSALKAERKALSTLYAELEEERSASAVAASQTLAMINRLQEEKAAMQMEALQYQRMMEEQSEYDQEALQLLNELMIKREKEKQELEKELDTYRKKVQEYEAKERIASARRSRTSSASCSNTEDSDGVSVDLNNEAKEVEDRAEGCEDISNQNTPAEAVLYLEESLTGFEEERLSILDQLRVLEEKLFTLSDGEEEKGFEDIKPIELYKENGNGCHQDSDALSGGEANGHSKETNGKHDHHQERRFTGAKAKRLLPFFDATEAEAEDGMLNSNGEGCDHVSMQDSSVFEFEHEGKRLTVEEEVDHVYERLQALEADREFLKHCISSLRKGDKGLCLLREILQHLRDLRSVEHRVRNMGDGVL